MFEEQSQVGLHVAETVEDGDGDPKSVECPKEVVGAGSGDETKLAGIFKDQLVGDPDGEVSQGEYGHQMNESSQEEKVSEGLESALLHHVTVVGHTQILQDPMQAFECV